MNTLVTPPRWHFTEHMVESFCPEDRVYLIDEISGQVHVFIHAGYINQRVDKIDPNVLESLLGVPEPTYYQAEINEKTPTYNMGGCY